ncbi:MAG: hypothetical protein KatS3mg044_0879 [Rhodothermaceae bacterium]|nr:MAG: hypothetical protein KatS3mg044_0879 [Rhodothermaceae bacterium]
MQQDLTTLRSRLDEIDGRLLEALADRQAVIAQIAALKARSHQPIRDVRREQALLRQRIARGRAAGLDARFVRTLFALILDHSVRLQRAQVDEAPAPADAPPPSSSGDGHPTVPPVLADTSKPYRLAARRHPDDDTVVRVGPVAIGGALPVLIAGPCSVESRAQIMACAAAVREAGGHLLRGGCFKPRTSPYAFQGLGYEGLALLAEAGRAYGLPVVTEVLDPADVPAVARLADVLQVGARNMQNFPLLKALGAAGRPVLLKRGMMASIDEWLAAAEYILAHGNPDVILCERGIRTFETATRSTLDLSAVPVVRERTHLPVIVDPSHASGTRRWVMPLARAALAAGAHGVMVEIHPEPERALSDGPQSLTFETFRELAATFYETA